ncbi:MAG: hypothetical protein HC915_15175 [Anaerolineae bacterium]|nr:hypothetical protein [Anaerolineae bacterium]
MSIAEIAHLLYFDRGNTPKLERALQLEALSPTWREAFQKVLAREIE